MPGPSLVCWLFILITTGSSGPGVLSPGASAGDAFTSIWVGVWVAGRELPYLPLLREQLQ